MQTSLAQVLLKALVIPCAGMTLFCKATKLSTYLYQYYGLDTMMYEVFLPFDFPTETPEEEIVIDQVAFYIKIFGNTYKRK